MAKCAYCNKEMRRANGCKKFLLISKGIPPRKYDPIPFGADGYGEPGERCSDCGALYGHYHHPGCDNERCPVCGGQLITCGCIEEY